MLVSREHRCGEGGVVAAGRLVGGGDDAAHRLGRRRPLDRGQAVGALDDVLGEDRSVGAEGRGRFPRIRLSPRAASVSWRSPLADSVSPTAATIALTPMIGPSMMSRVRLHRAVRPGDGDADEIADASHGAPPSVPPKLETVAPPLS